MGLGLGGLGTFAALFHTLNHSVCKTLAFFAAGRLGQMFGTHDMERMAGSLKVSPVWGIGIFASLLALIGVAPFSFFMSEFQILKAAIDGGGILVVILFLAGTGAVFVGALGHALPLAWGDPVGNPQHLPMGKLDAFLVAGPLILLLVLGIWMPQSLQTALHQAAAIVQATAGIPIGAVK